MRLVLRGCNVLYGLKEWFASYEKEESMPKLLDSGWK